MTKLRKIHFVIHNQGSYACSKKDALLELIKIKYGENLEGYLICQEMYKENAEDSHLQGNLFFKNPIHFTALLKLIKSKYKEEHTDKGLRGRTDLSQVLHEGRAYNYMINSKKEGGDANPISDMAQLDYRRIRERIDTDFRDLCDYMRRYHCLQTEILQHNDRYHQKLITEQPIFDSDEPRNLPKEMKDFIVNNLKK